MICSLCPGSTQTDVAVLFVVIIGCFEQKWYDTNTVSSESLREISFTFFFISIWCWHRKSNKAHLEMAKEGNGSQRSE